MASMTLTSLISDIRGSAGGITFSRNSFGAFIKKRDGKIRKLSSAAREQKNRFQNLVKYWGNELTADEQTSWNTYAQQIFYTNSQGNKYKLNGFHSFVKTNTYRLIAGLSILTTGPNEGQKAENLIINAASIFVTESPQHISIFASGIPNFDNTAADRILMIYTANQIKNPSKKTTTPFTIENVRTTIFSGGAGWQETFAKKIPNAQAGLYLPMKFRQISPDGKVSDTTKINKLVT